MDMPACPLGSLLAGIKLAVWRKVHTALGAAVCVLVVVHVVQAADF
ncbi:MAG TPA: hypothetical protein H9697_11545 [Candidatus Mediterraneibacter faecavium]|uniref:Uncharacterized protein n=1 Tax=Candidatus Mediterraneibacter faecavium TaxID=2838668 RepID=A0A9D2TP26_9FIRM|nr:hypothetical protein [Candidatus Mediterraneibacter faecavium]